MDSQKRLMLALALCFVFVMGVNLLWGPKGGPPQPLATADLDGGTPVPVPGSSGGLMPSSGTGSGAGPAGADQAGPVVELERDFAGVRYRLSSLGAGLSRAEIQGPKNREQERVGLAEAYQRILGGKLQEAPQVDMAAPVAARALPLSISIEGAQPLPSNLNYTVDPAASSERKVVFTGRRGGWEVTKTFEWAEGTGEQLTLEVAVKNVGGQAAAGELGVYFARSVDPASEEKSSFFGGVGNQSKSACRVGDKVERWVPSDKPAPEFKGTIDFFGIDQQYFVAAVMPRPDQRAGRCVLEASPIGRWVGAYFPISVAPGQTLTRTFGVFVGAKDVERLAEVTAPVLPAAAAAVADASPHLEKSVDFGLWAAICKVMLGVLKFFHGLVHNWGVAIILLTVLIKVGLLPLTHKSMVSAEAMKKLQPKMEAIKKKFPDDRERQNLETMKLYQENKVNPLGGCLPVLVQMPVWIALYSTLRNSFELYREPFILPVWTDLTYKDPTYVLPLLLGITMVLTQRLQPQMTADKTQAAMMTYIMPVFFTFLMLSYPAGLTLYIFTNNLLSILQQYGLKRYLRSKEAAA